MPNLTDLIQLSAVGIALVVLLYVVRAFLKTLEKQEDSFTTIITNHLMHNNEALAKVKETLEETKQAQQAFCDTVKELLVFLRKNNGHH